MADFEEIDVQNAKGLIDQGQVQLVDVRSEEAYEEGHIENAKNVHQENIEEFVKNADKKKPVLCYCFMGFSSRNVAQYLKDQGFDKVYSMTGGYTEWQKSHEGQDGP